MKIVSQSVSLEFITPDAMKLIERIGRTCYKSEDKITDESADKFVKMLLERGHESVIEHAYASFRVVCDRGVSHEFVRHRIFSYSQESTRYCNYSKAKHGKEITVIEPPGLTPESKETWMALVACAERAYFDLLAHKTTPEIARSVLPTCLKTELVGTANFREWCLYLKQRLAKNAHPQMRHIAHIIWQCLYEQYPVIFGQDWLLELSSQYTANLVQ